MTSLTKFKHSVLPRKLISHYRFGFLILSVSSFISSIYSVAGFPCSPRTKLWLGLYWEKPRVQGLTSSSYSAAQTGLTGFRISFVCCYCNLSGDV